MMRHGLRFPPVEQLFILITLCRVPSETSVPSGTLEASVPNFEIKGMLLLDPTRMSVFEPRLWRLLRSPAVWGRAYAF